MALSEWRETQRVQTEGFGSTMCCALKDSRVLFGNLNSTDMELFRVESGSRIAPVHRIHLPEKYYWFSATCGSDMLVALRYEDMSMRVHRLRDDRLEELARNQLRCTGQFLWLGNRLLVVDGDRDEPSHAVLELEMSGTRLERSRELIPASENNKVHKWCAMDDGLLIFEGKSRDIHSSSSPDRRLCHQCYFFAASLCDCIATIYTT